MEQVALICSNPRKKLGNSCHTAARLCSDTLTAFGLGLISADFSSGIQLKFIASQDFTPCLWYLGDSLQRSELNPGQAVVEGWLLRISLTFHLPFPQAISHHYSSGMFSCRIAPYNGVSFLMTAAATAFGFFFFPFFLLNQYIPPMVLEPPSLWTTTAETHQFQPALNTEALHFQFFSWVLPHPSEWAGRWDAEGKGRRQLWFVAVTPMQDKEGKWGRIGLLGPGPPWGVM